MATAICHAALLQVVFELFPPMKKTSKYSY